MTPEQQRAAELLARGFSQREVGRLVGRSERTIRAWLHDLHGFREAARAVHAEAIEPTALDTLRLALSATAKDGRPDWSIRVQAAKALLRAQPEKASAEPTFVHVTIQPDGTIVGDSSVIEPAEAEPHPGEDPEPVAAFERD